MCRGCLCRSCLAWAPNSIAEADEVARCQYFQVHSTSLRRGKTMWTRLGRRPRVRHGQHAARLGSADCHHDLDWVGDYVLACAWVLRGDDSRLPLHGPGPPGPAALPTVTSAWRYMPLHDDSLHEITCYYVDVIACNYMLLHACHSL